MEIILHKDVIGVGHVGDIVKVTDGYARNFLLPKGMAEKVTPAVLKAWEGRREKLGQEKAEKEKVAAGLAEKIQGLELEIKEKAGEEEQLFGSVNSARIAELLKEAGHEVAAGAVILESPIKKLGEYEVELKLGQKPYPKVKLKVEKE